MLKKLKKKKLVHFFKQKFHFVKKIRAESGRMFCFLDAESGRAARPPGSHLPGHEGTLLPVHGQGGGRCTGAALLQRQAGAGVHRDWYRQGISIDQYFCFFLLLFIFFNVKKETTVILQRQAGPGVHRHRHCQGIFNFIIINFIANWYVHTIIYKYSKSHYLSFI